MFFLYLFLVLIIIHLYSIFPTFKSNIKKTGSDKTKTHFTQILVNIQKEKNLNFHSAKALKKKIINYFKINKCSSHYLYSLKGLKRILFILFNSKSEKRYFQIKMLTESLKFIDFPAYCYLSSLAIVPKLNSDLHLFHFYN